MDEPGTFRIRVSGTPSRDWLRAFWDNVCIDPLVSDGEVEVMLIGELPDQAALIGLINALYNMGHAVIAIERLVPGEETGCEAIDVAIERSPSPTERLL
jgi:hypothetical protein